MSTWFITGASRGFGAEIARAVLRHGDNVVLTARKVDQLPEGLEPSDRLFAVAMDVTDHESVEAAVTQAVERFGRIDVLVNNAGRAVLGAIEEINDREARSLFDLNVFGLLDVTRAVLPVMRAQRSGVVVNMGSRAGFEGEPGTGIYNASKFAVAGISEALDAEVRAFGIRAVVVEPGVFRTDFLDASSLQLPQRRIPEYDGTPAHQTLEWSTEANHAQLGDPVKGAELIYRVVASGDLPSHLYLGRDSIERREAMSKRAEQEIAAWRDASVATAHDDA
ncbi:SDR family NAD(P)-dependent oxidoreductase [Catenuloplanes atrovinosus]|uniref:NADP-dependent 3-hydroxy acid dehydrogenase YdfG n=1 Tax=Catenuloplanes atrovinosus TaxID=137266 RepID=A0AAE3YRS3_9ACTN|nr:SDR family NAD(P)-dependent oxidoreductase [Catenuloplanes atrovinosus]MDR7277263.1 NADP-dependent 3-hydroxy acid dehydrogenase YdfG [Catenuloplanes atrovinosus]